jgi:1-acyl-sn-glycerol-3-phosphate acyltransferase
MNNNTPVRPDRLEFSATTAAGRAKVWLGSRVLVTGGSLAGSIVGPRVGRQSRRSFERRLASAATWALDLTVHAVGLDSIQDGMPYIVAPLHEGFADVMALMRLPIDLRFVVRKELVDLPRLGSFINAGDHIPIADSPSRADLRDLLRRIEDTITVGESPVVFPQGSILGVEVAFASGALRIARHLGVPILPVVLSGSHLVYEHPFSPTVRFGRTISMTVLPPMEPENLEIGSFRELERTMKRRALADREAPVRRFVPERDGWWDDYEYSIDEDFPDLYRRVAEHRLSVPPTAEPEPRHPLSA